MMAGLDLRRSWAEAIPENLHSIQADRQSVAMEMHQFQDEGR